MNELQVLWEYQQILQEEEKVMKQLKKLPQTARLKILKEEIELEQSMLQELTVSAKKLDASIKSLENEIESIKYKQKEISTKLYGGEITNVKELESTNLQLEQLNDEISVIENNLINLMEEKEALNEKINQRKAALESPIEEFRALHGEYQTMKATLKNQLDAFPAHKDNLLSRVDNDLLAIYNDLQKKLIVPVITKIDKGICAGCHMRISFDLQNKIKDTNDLLHCDNCGRIILID